MKSKEFLELQESYSRLQSKVQSKNNEIEMLQTKIANLESRYALYLYTNLSIGFHKSHNNSIDF